MMIMIITYKWVCHGSIPFETHPIGIKIPFNNSIYFNMDIAEVDPEYRLYLLGYSVKNKIEKSPYKPKCMLYHKMLTEKLKGHCYCCLRKCEYDNICLECNYSLPSCNIKVL